MKKIKAKINKMKGTPSLIVNKGDPKTTDPSTGTTNGETKEKEPQVKREEDIKECLITDNQNTMGKISQGSISQSLPQKKNTSESESITARNCFW